METNDPRDRVEKSQGIIPESKTTIGDMFKVTIDHLLNELQKDDCQGNQDFWKKSARYIAMLDQCLRLTKAGDDHLKLIHLIRQVAVDAFNGEDVSTAITLLKGLRDNVHLYTK